jgi:hypothetical protein
MLNEYLDRDSARRFVAIGPASVLESAEGRRFIENGIFASGNEVVTVEIGRRHRALTLLAFGVEPEPLTKERFRAFCSELLSTYGWRVAAHPDNDELIVTTFDTDRKRQFLLGFLVVSDSIQTEIDNFSREYKMIRDMPDFIITNVRPSRGARVVIGRRKIKTVHYSDISELTKLI